MVKNPNHQRVHNPCYPVQFEPNRPSKMTGSKVTKLFTYLNPSAFIPINGKWIFSLSLWNCCLFRANKDFTRVALWMRFCCCFLFSLNFSFLSWMSLAREFCYFFSSSIVLISEGWLPYIFRSDLFRTPKAIKTFRAS